MKAALFVALNTCVVASLLAVPTGAQERGPTFSNRNATAPADCPLARAIAREAIRLGAEDAKRTLVTDVRKGTGTWSDVRELEGEEIVLTLRDQQPAKRYVVRGSISETGLTVLNLADRAIPTEVAEALADAAWRHAEYFSSAPLTGSVRLNKSVRLVAGDVLLNDRKVVELARVVEQVARGDVVEISYSHRAVKQGVGWGALGGFLAGVTIIVSKCGVHWSELSGCPNLTGIWLFFGPGLGTGVGAAIGADSRVTTVVYRAPYD